MVGAARMFWYQVVYNFRFVHWREKAARGAENPVYIALLWVVISWQHLKCSLFLPLFHVSFVVPADTESGRGGITRAKLEGDGTRQ